MGELLKSWGVMRGVMTYENLQSRPNKIWYSAIDSFQEEANPISVQSFSHCISFSPFNPSEAQPRMDKVTARQHIFKSWSVFSCRDIDSSLLRPDNDKWNTDGAGLSSAGPHPSPSLSLAYWDLYCAVMHCTHTRVSLSRSRWYQAEVR